MVDLGKVSRDKRTVPSGIIGCHNVQMAQLKSEILIDV
jgi:hypothetical protein